MLCSPASGWRPPWSRADRSWGSSQRTSLRIAVHPRYRGLGVRSRWSAPTCRSLPAGRALADQDVEVRSLASLSTGRTGTLRSSGRARSTWRRCGPVSEKGLSSGAVGLATRQGKKGNGPSEGPFPHLLCPRSRRSREVGVVRRCQADQAPLTSAFLERKTSTDPRHAGRRKCSTSPSCPHGGGLDRRRSMNASDAGDPHVA